MEKARLTKAQAGALDRACQTYTAIEAVIYLHAKGATDGQEWGSYFAPLNEVGMDALCRALYVGYEVIEEEQVVTVTEEMREGLLKALRYPMGKELEQWDEGFAAGMKSTLEQLGIAIKGINE